MNATWKLRHVFVGAKLYDQSSGSGDANKSRCEMPVESEASIRMGPEQKPQKMATGILGEESIPPFSADLLSHPLATRYLELTLWKEIN